MKELSFARCTKMGLCWGCLFFLWLISAVLSLILSYFCFYAQTHTCTHTHARTFIKADWSCTCSDERKTFLWHTTPSMTRFIRTCLSTAVAQVEQNSQQCFAHKHRTLSKVSFICGSKTYRAIKCNYKFWHTGKTRHVGLFLEVEKGSVAMCNYNNLQDGTLHRGKCVGTLTHSWFGIYTHLWTTWPLLPHLSLNSPYTLGFGSC